MDETPIKLPSFLPNGLKSLLLSPTAAWWFRFLQRPFAGFFGGWLIVFALWSVSKGAGEDTDLPFPYSLIANASGLAAGIGVGIYYFRRVKGPDIPTSRPRRDKWKSEAVYYAILYTFGVFLIVGIALGVLEDVVLLVRVALDSSRDLAQPQTIQFTRWVTRPLWIWFTVWSLIAVSNEYYQALKSVVPPPLRRVYAIRERAQALEEAMEDATLLSEELERVIEEERKLANEEREKHDQAAILKQLTQQQVDELYRDWKAGQRQAERRGIWINILVALIFYVLGVLFSPEAIRDWLGSGFQ